MLMDSKLAIVFALAIVVIVAGCAQKNTGNVHAGYPGATITEFDPIAPSIKAGIPINFFLTVQNFGYSDATSANVVLFNCGSANTGTSTGKTGAYKCNDKLFSKDFDLNKPDSSLGIAGDSREVDITLDTKPSDFPQGRTEQTFTARLSYDYSTSASRDVFFTTFDNWRQKGGNVPIPALNSFSDPAPLSLVINGPQPPFIINDQSNPIEEFTVGLSIRNTGGGFVPDKTLKEIALCFDTNFIINVDPGDFDSSKGGNCLTITKKENLQLIGLDNQYKDVDARFKVKPNAVAVQDVTTFDAKITYTYSVDKSTKVTVQNS